MSCCSTQCERYWICARTYENGLCVNWHDYGSGGSEIADVSYCGSEGNYNMFKPVDECILENKIAAYQVALERLKQLKQEETTL